MFLDELDRNDHGLAEWVAVLKVSVKSSTDQGYGPKVLTCEGFEIRNRRQCAVDRPEVVV